MRMADLKPGWKVVSNDGFDVGTVREVGQHFLLVARSGRGGDLYVPASAIAMVQQSSVRLNVNLTDSRELGWEQPPRTGDEPTGTEDELHRHI